VEAEWLRRTMDAAGHAFFSLDADGLILGCNRPAQERFGHARADLTGLDFGETIVAERTRAAYQAGLRRAHERPTRTGRELRLEVSALHHEGHEVPVELAIVAVEVDGDPRFHLFARVLHEPGERMSAILHVAPDAIITTDRRGLVTSFNPAAARLTGHPVDEALGRPLELLLRAESDDDQQRIQHAASSGRSLELTAVPHLLRDRRGLRIDLTVSPLSDASGRLVGAATVARAAAAPAVHQRRTWERRIRELCDSEDGLRIALQPVVDLVHGTVRGYEALARFSVDPVSPAEWFAAADEVGLGGLLGACAIRTALERRRDLPPGCAIGVNVSPQALMTEEVQAVFHEAGALSDVIVEITEQSAVSDYVSLRAALDDLRDRGARVAVDDTGAGYACLRHVLSIAPEFVKIDRSLISGIDGDPARAAVIETLGALAARIEAELVAEGVETLSELRALIRLDLRLAQGYLFAAPGLDPAGIAPEALAALGTRV
jgi:PAS domain S-box-containing protein